MTDAELKALAERAREAAADNGHCGEGTMERRDRHAFQDATLSDFRRHATPDRVLAILADKAALESEVYVLSQALTVWMRAMETGKSELLFVARDYTARMMSVIILRYTFGDGLSKAGQADGGGDV